MIGRRRFLQGSALLPAAAGLASLPGTSSGAGEDYRALVVVFLRGGNDGHNTLVPTDGLYNDYLTARQNLAIPKASLAPLSGSAAGHTFGVHPGLRPLVPLYTARRLAFIANAGPLFVPATVRQVLDAAVDVPPFLLSHNDQAAIVQGWTVTDDMSGWAGRGLELLPDPLRHSTSAVTLSTDRTLVLGRHSPVSMMSPFDERFWGLADLSVDADLGNQLLTEMSRWRSRNAYDAEYGRSLDLALGDSKFFQRVRERMTAPSADFGSEDQPVVRNLRALGGALPVFKAEGLRRQVFLVEYGGFDTHANQRGSSPETQDALLVTLGQALAAFDATNQANGMDSNVVTLVMSEFGRTVRPGSGGGSEHAWGNHWWAMGGPVAGGTVIGAFPSPVLGGPDDGDPRRNGRHVPGISTDQVGATLMQWLGLPAAQLHEVFPYLAQFTSKTIPLLRA